MNDLRASAGAQTKGRSGYRLAKRALDIFASALILTLGAPFLGAVAWLIRRDGSPALYRGKRAGKGGMPFMMLKFRTMVRDADRTGASSTPQDDARITRIGLWLRKRKIDELPQLINVLRGDMSLVGPRPQVLEEVAKYTNQERHLLDVLPGITDYASILYSNEGEILRGADDPHAAYVERIRPGKICLGLEYVATRSLGTDIKILALTVLTLFNRRAALRFVPPIQEEQ